MRQLGDRLKTSTKSCRVQGRRPKSPALVDGKQGRRSDKKVAVEDLDDWYSNTISRREEGADDG